MNVEECTRLVALVRTLYPAQRFDENPRNVVEAWGLVVADVDYDEAKAAVVRLSRRGTQWVSPGDLRREVAASRHVLSPDVDVLVQDVREVARLQGVGRRQLHPAAQRVYDTIGGAETIKRLDGYGLDRLRRQIAEQVEKYDAWLLAQQMPPAQPPHTPLQQRKLTAPAELEEAGAGVPPPEHVRKALAAAKDFGKMPS